MGAQTTELNTGANTASGSAHAAQRAQFRKLFDKLRKGDTLVVSKLERLGRDAPAVLATIKRLAALDVEVVVLLLGKLDLASPAGKLMLAMLTAVAEMERDLLVERTQAGLLRARAEGRTLGRPRKTNQEQRAAMIEAYQRGSSISALERLYAVSRSTAVSSVKPRSKTA